MLSEIRKKYENWIRNSNIAADLKKELLSISEVQEIEDRFYRDLEFGTGGLRGVMGAGTNRVNVFTIRKATQGLADYLNKQIACSKNVSVSIAYDSRNLSDVFAEEAALVLAANNIKVYLFDSLRPTPELSFAVRLLKCEAGIVITASHNPPEYNGYKVYGSDGGQITLTEADSITKEIEKLEIFDDVRTCSKESAIENGLLEYIGERIDNEYIKKVKELSINSDVSRKSNDLKIVYTPIHGSGLMLIKRVLNELGYNNLNIVASQMLPDGNFPTVKSPNPEEREALTEAIKLGESLKADIVLGTDPDADRVGVAIRNVNNEFVLLSGNQIGALLTYYLVTQKSNITSKDVVIKTIVTSDLGTIIAEHYGTTVIDTLTGFKFIGEKIKEFEENGNYNFLFGYEESYGYLAGTFVRDKDAIIASALIIEMAAYYKLQSESLLDVLECIYKKFGYFNDDLESFTLKGKNGREEIESIVNKFRNIDEILIGFPSCVVLEDFKAQIKYNHRNQSQDSIILPSSNVIKIHLEDGSWLAVRPSGTEPKLKIYYSAKADNKFDVLEKMSSLKHLVKVFMSQKYF